MDIGDIYIGTDKSLEEQVQAIYRYCQEFHSDSVLLAALGSLEENVVVVECNEVYLRGGAKTTKMPELSDEKIKAIRNEAAKRAGDYASATEGNFSPKDIDAIFDDADRAIAKAQRELLKGWIPLPSDERMADITAKAGGLPSPEWKTILKMLQAE